MTETTEEFRKEVKIKLDIIDKRVKDNVGIVKETTIDTAKQHYFRLVPVSRSTFRRQSPLWKIMVGEVNKQQWKL